jgi:hypothetical protein
MSRSLHAWLNHLTSLIIYFLAFVSHIHKKFTVYTILQKLGETVSELFYFLFFFISNNKQSR